MHQSRKELCMWSGAHQEEFGQPPPAAQLSHSRTPKRTQTLPYPSTLHPMKIWYHLIMVSVANIPRSTLLRDLESLSVLSSLFPYFTLKTLHDCLNICGVFPPFWVVSTIVQSCHLKHNKSLISKENRGKKSPSPQSTEFSSLSRWWKGQRPNQVEVNLWRPLRTECITAGKRRQNPVGENGSKGQFGWNTEGLAKA